VVVTSVVLLLGSSSGALAQLTNAWPPYEALYCFGFSWTDTQGLYMSGQPDFVNGNPDYWQNRACNGPVWPEFLSTNLGLTYTTSNNLARGAATTADTLTQAASLRTIPDAARNLYVTWVAAGDFLNEVGTTSDSAWNFMITNVLNTSSKIIQRLYAEGARSVLVQNCLDLSLAPNVIRQLGSDTNQLAKLKEHTAFFNSRLQDIVFHIQEVNHDLRVCVVDIFAPENEVYTNSAAYGFTKVFPDALSESNTAFTGPGADYMFWDGLHGTSKFQQLVAKWTGEALTNAAPETLGVQLGGSGVTLRMNHLLPGRAYTLQKSLDLMHWQQVTSFAATAGTNQWTEMTPASPEAFYRIGWNP
jgi:phospholipase/lecithinase/hemolysin